MNWILRDVIKHLIAVLNPYFLLWKGNFVYNLQK